MISDLEPISNWVNVINLHLANNNIGANQLHHFRHLNSLRHLSLYENPLEDISGLRLLGAQLEELHLSEVESGYEDVEELTELRILSIRGTNHSHIPEAILSDISFVSDLSNLEFIDLAYNDIEDISPLEGLENLSHINLSHNHGLRDITPLVNNRGIGLDDEIYFNDMCHFTSGFQFMISELRERGVIVKTSEVANCTP